MHIKLNVASVSGYCLYESEQICLKIINLQKENKDFTTPYQSLCNSLGVQLAVDMKYIGKYFINILGIYNYRIFYKRQELISLTANKISAPALLIEC